MNSYKVTLFEHIDEESAINFYCRADDKDHAQEQGLNAYPDGRIVNVVLCSDQEYPYVIHKEMEG